MNSRFRGIAVFLLLVGIALLLFGLMGVWVSVAQPGSTSTAFGPDGRAVEWGHGPTTMGIPFLGGAGELLLEGAACLAASAVAFTHAVTRERLARIEAKLDALAEQRGARRAGGG